MKIRKIAKAHMATAIVLSTTLLFVGCGTNTTKEAEPDMIEEENSSNKNLVIENDVKEENQDKDITNGMEMKLRKKNTVPTFKATKSPLQH